MAEDQQNDIKKVPESRLQVSFFETDDENDKLMANPKRIFDKIEVWEAASEKGRKMLLVNWLIQNQNFLTIKNIEKLLSYPPSSEERQRIDAVLEEFYQACDKKIFSTTNLGGTIRKRLFNKNTDISFVLNMVAREKGYLITL